MLNRNRITMNVKRHKRVALYVRVSTDHQSVRNQEIELQAVAERHGWTVVTVFKDQGIRLARAKAGGTRLGRPATVADDAAKVQTIRAARATGKSIRTIAREEGVGIGTVSRLTG